MRPEFSGGVPGHVYGGMVASLLDCHGTASAAAYAYWEAGRAMGDDGEFMRFVTASLSLSAGGETCAKAEMLAVQFRD